MSGLNLFRGRRREVACTVDVSCTGASLHAHVELDDATRFAPGDRVRVHGPPITVAFGEELRLRRTATIFEAGPARQAWTRLLAHFELADLYEVSFTSGRLS
jgi:hypothetical protein